MAQINVYAFMEQTYYVTETSWQKRQKKFSQVFPVSHSNLYLSTSSSWINRKSLIQPHEKYFKKTNKFFFCIFWLQMNFLDFF